MALRISRTLWKDGDCVCVHEGKISTSGYYDKGRLTNAQTFMMASFHEKL